MLSIKQTDLNFEREPLVKPFGFKGGYVSNLWQLVVRLSSQSGNSGLGIGTQSVLWSDPRVAAQHTEQGGNTLMAAMTEYALTLLKGRSFSEPIAILEELLEDVLEYGRSVTRIPSLRTTFGLNALVCVDLALWLLYAQEHAFTTLDALIPAAYRAPFSSRNSRVVSVPVVSYNTSDVELHSLLKAGYFVFKIKLGAPGNQKDMVRQDKDRLSTLHALLKAHATPHLPEGHIPYYLDANGRYEEKDTLLDFLDHADKIGALDRIAILEEPFPEHLDIDVRSFPVCIAADESAHTDHDALQRIEMGYKAIALKPIAKTLSMTLKIAHTAHQHKIPCFCADLSVNPILVEWNKAFAARLAPFPGIGLPLLEMNGHQNYRHWNRMRTYLPDPSASWISDASGVFQLDDSYYERNGDLFSPSPHYAGLVQ